VDGVLEAGEAFLMINLRELYLARHRILPYIRRTPLVASPWLSGEIGTSVYLKLECLQETGSFKVRGAANRILALAEEERARGVVAVSTGNHGRAVAFVADRLGIPATICISARVPPGKVEAIRRLGARIELHGASYDEAEFHARALQREEGQTFIEPFDDPLVIAGQGTVGLELLEDLPEIDTAVVPLSGGGLLGGIAVALKAADPGIHVVGVSMERAPVMYHSLKAGRPISLPEEETLADALAGGIGLENRYTFPLVQQVMDDAVLVREDEIAAAMDWALEEHHLVVEGGGAVGLAALLHRKVPRQGKQLAVVLSGGNVGRVPS
jgi:threonine dehydratase